MEELWIQSVKHDDNDDDEDSNNDGEDNGDTGNGCKLVKWRVHDRGQLQLLGLLFVMVKFWVITTVRVSVSSVQIMDET